MNNKFMLVGIFFVFIILTGLWLSRTGRPINVLLLTIHKLISVAAIIFLIVTVYRIHQVNPLSPVEISVSAVSLLFFVALIATGGLLSTAKTMPSFVLRIHQVMPALTILSTAATLYFVMLSKP